MRYFLLILAVVAFPASVLEQAWRDLLYRISSSLHFAATFPAQVTSPSSDAIVANGSKLMFLAWATTLIQIPFEVSGFRGLVLVGAGRFGSECNHNRTPLIAMRLDSATINLIGD